jgi:hypothetical protein
MEIVSGLLFRLSGLLALLDGVRATHDERLHCGAVNSVCTRMMGSGWRTRECTRRLYGRGRFGGGMAGY